MLSQTVRNLRFLTIAGVLIGLMPIIASAAVPKDLVKASLLADANSVKAGKPFTVGVLLKLTPGWHVYWKNPGDSGMPTSVDWKLPEGLKAGELEYPVPMRFDQPGNVVGFGYENEVMLMTTITPPAELPPDKPVEISAGVGWLVCEKVCVPGRAGVQVSLPVGDGGPDNQETFDSWRKKLPVPADKLSGVDVHAEPLDLSSGAASGDIVSSVAINQLPIPDAIEGLDLSIREATAISGGARFRVTAKILKGQQIHANHVEVLVGRYRVNVPIVGVAGPATAPLTQ